MTVSTVGSTVSYAGTGVTTTFGLPYPYQHDTDLVVTVTVDLTGVATTLVLGTDYIVNPANNSPATNGSVITTNPVASGSTITIRRAIPLTQGTTWQTNDAYPANFNRVEDALDKLTMALTDFEETPLHPGGDASTFVRGDGTLSNTLVGTLGAAALPVDTTALFTAQQTANASIRVGCGSTSQGAFSFAADASSNPWDMRWVYDPQLSIIGWQSYGGSIIGTFSSSGIDVSTGTINGAHTGTADAAILTSGTIATARLGSGSATSNTFLRGDQTWAVVSGGGGGINTTTTATFVIAAVNSTQTVSVTDATGIVVGTDLQISDGTHLIIGLVTAVASLDLTVKTQQIALGVAGDTMASGAAVQQGNAPGNNTILFGDSTTSPAAITNLQLFGSLAGRPGGTTTVDLFVQSLGGGTGIARGYVNSNFSIDFIHAPTTAKDQVVTKAAAGTQWLPLSPSAQGDILHATSGTAVGFSKITASDSITAATITPALLNCTNALTDTQVFSYDSASGHFKMVAQTTGVPGGGTVGGFLRGDGSWSNALRGGDTVLVVSQDTTGTSVATTYGSAISSLSSGSITPVQYSGASYSTITAAPWFSINAPIACATTTYPLTAIDGVHGQTESAFGMNLRAVGVIRGNSGHWNKIRFISGPTGTVTIDPSTGPYVVFSSIAANFTIALADNTAVPTISGIAYAGDVTIEFQDTGSNVITWPGSITWVDGGSAPTPSASGTTVVRLIRAQSDGTNAARWIGYRLASSSAAAYTDAQARSAVLNATYLADSSTIAMNVVAGTSATPAVKANSIGNSQLASGIQASKLQGYPSPPNANVFLNGAGGWTVPPGTGGSSGGYVVYNVKSSGAVGNGVADDTTAIQNAINAAIANGGGTVYFPPGTYLISSSLTMTQGVNLLGDGISRGDPGGAQPAAVSTIKWGGASSGVMVSLTGRIGGMVWQGLEFDGNSVAGTGWYFEALTRSVIRACAIYNCTSYGIHITTQDGGGADTSYNCQFNQFSALHIDCRSSGASGIRIQAASHNNNTCHNLFTQIDIVHGARALDIDWSDNNDFLMLFCYRAAGSSSDIYLRYNATPAAGCCSARFYHTEGTIEVDDGCVGNQVYGYDQLNGQAAPTIHGDGQLLNVGGPSLNVTSAPTTGSTVALNPLGPVTTVIIPPAGTLANLTVTLSKGSMDGQRVSITMTQAITTFSGPGDGTYIALPTTLTAGQKITYVWRVSSAKWYYIGA